MTWPACPRTSLAGLSADLLPFRPFGPFSLALQQFTSTAWGAAFTLSQLVSLRARRKEMHEAGVANDARRYLRFGCRFLRQFWFPFLVVQVEVACHVDSGFAGV